MVWKKILKAHGLAILTDCSSFDEILQSWHSPQKCYITNILSRRYKTLELICLNRENTQRILAPPALFLLLWCCVDCVHYCILSQSLSAKLSFCFLMVQFLLLMFTELGHEPVPAIYYITHPFHFFPYSCLLKVGAKNGSLPLGLGKVTSHALQPLLQIPLTTAMG